MSSSDLPDDETQSSDNPSIGPLNNDDSDDGHNDNAGIAPVNDGGNGDVRLLNHDNDDDYTFGSDGDDTNGTGSSGTDGAGGRQRRLQLPPAWSDTSFGGKPGALAIHRSGTQALALVRNEANGVPGTGIKGVLYYSESSGFQSLPFGTDQSLAVPSDGSSLAQLSAGAWTAKGATETHIIGATYAVIPSFPWLSLTTTGPVTVQETRPHT